MELCNRIKHITSSVLLERLVLPPLLLLYYNPYIIYYTMMYFYLRNPLRFITEIEMKWDGKEICLKFLQIIFHLNTVFVKSPLIYWFSHHESAFDYYKMYDCQKSHCNRCVFRAWLRPENKFFIFILSVPWKCQHTQ